MRRNRLASVLAVLALVPVLSTLAACQSTASAPAAALATAHPVSTTAQRADDTAGAVIYIARDAAYARVERSEKIAAAWSTTAQ